MLSPYPQTSDQAGKTWHGKHTNLQGTLKIMTIKSFITLGSGLVAWIVSRCYSLSDRDDYVNELSRFVPVDIFGYCGTLSCSYENEADCLKTIEHNYKFYLSFENGVCDDYVTEKLFRAFNISVIPIVLGGADYSSFAPHKSYIDVNDFESIEKLAEYLKYLDSNTTAFAEYFEWKYYFRARDDIEKYIFCDVCKALNEDSSTKVYEDLDQWWRKEAHCKAKGTLPWSKK